MAQMARGGPRTVPDPVGELYEEMLREERRKKHRAEAAGRQVSAAADYFSTRDPLAFARQPPARRPGLQVDGRPINAPSVVANPRASVATPAELAERRRAIERAFFMANNPLAGSAYGLATLANTSPQARDAALAVGGVFDAAMLGAAPRGAPLRGPPRPVPQHTAALDLQAAAIRPRELNSLGQARGVNATVSAPMLGTGTRANQRLTPPGWRGGEYESRAHLHPKDQGGSGNDARNIVTATQNPTNSSHMTRFDNRVKRRVRGGEIVETSATPFYAPGVLPPTWILQTAFGPLGGPIAQLVRNPAGWRR